MEVVVPEVVLMRQLQKPHILGVELQELVVMEEVVRVVLQVVMELEEQVFMVMVLILVGVVEMCQHHLHF